MLLTVRKWRRYGVFIADTVLEKEETGAYEKKFVVSVDGEKSRHPVCAGAGERGTGTVREEPETETQKLTAKDSSEREGHCMEDDRTVIMKKRDDPRLLLPAGSSGTGKQPRVDKPCRIQPEKC